MWVKRQPICEGDQIAHSSVAIKALLDLYLQ